MKLSSGRFHEKYNQLLKMTQQFQELTFLELMKRASSKDFPEEEEDGDSFEHNPEDNFDLGLPSGVWRTNLMIEGEEERREKTLLLCRVTSIEDNFHNTSIFKNVK